MTNIIVDSVKIQFWQKRPAALPWKDLKVDVVIGSTGFFTNSKPLATGTLKAGAKKLVN